MASRKIFISYARRDGADLAQRLQADLKASACDVWLDTQRIAGGASWTREIETALDQSDVVLALLTPGSYVSEVCRAEQLRSLRKGKCVIALLVDRTADIPLYLEPKNYLDFTVADSYSRQLARLLEDIEVGKGISLPERYRITPATYITAPPTVMNYIERPEAVRALRDTLFEADGHRAIALTALEGMGGIGKTVLAQALFQDEVVREAFPDGLVWVTVGRESTGNIAARLREILTVLGGETEKDISPETLYKSALAGKAALIVIDDIWSKADLDPFLADSARSRFLFTTRDASIAKFSGAGEYRADLLDTGQAQELLALWADWKVTELPLAAGEILRQCNGLPLALSMIGALLRGAAGAEWADTAERLRKSDLTAIEQQLPSGQPSFFSAIDVSVKALPAKMQQCYGQLAVLLDDMPAPLPVLETLWGVDEAEGRRIRGILADRSLVQLGEEDNIRLHDLQLRYIQAQYLEKESLEFIHGAIRLSSHVIAKDPTQFASQLVGRLLVHEGVAGLRRFTSALREGSPRPWLLARQPVLDSPGGALIRTLAGHTDSVNGVALSADGSLAVSASSDTRLKVWDVKSGQELCTLAGHTDSVNAVALSADGRCAISGSRDKTLKVWDVKSGQELRTLAGHTESVSGVALSGDGRLAISGSRDKTLKVWDVKSGQELRTLEGPPRRGKAVAVSGDGKLAISASRDKTLKVWDVKSGQELHNLAGHTGSITGVAMSGDGKRAVSSYDDTRVKVWDVVSGQQLRSLVGHSDWVLGVAMSGDGKRAVSASDDKTVKVWDVESGRQLRTLVSHSTWVNGVAISGDGKLVVSASRDKTVKVWEVEGGSELRILPGHADSVNGVAVSRDGRLAVSASDDRTVKVWDVENGRELFTLSGHTDSVYGVAMTSDGRLAISGSSDRMLKIWDVQKKRELLTLSGHKDVVTGVAITEDGGLAVSASSDTTLRVWDVERGKNLHTFRTDTRIGAGVAVSGDGRFVLFASRDKTVKVRDVKRGRELRTLKGHTGLISGVAMSGDGRLAVSASDDHTVKVWDVQSGLELRTLKGHTSHIGGIAISGDGARVVSASNDNTVKVWDAERGLDLATFTCEGAALCCAFCSPTSVIAGDAGGRVYFLELVS